MHGFDEGRGSAAPVPAVGWTGGAAVR